MIARFTKTVRRLIAAVRRTPKPLRYAALSGGVLADVEAGRLIRTGTFLDRVGGADLPDGKQSWFGRHVKSAHIAATGTEPLRVWAQQRTTGKWIHVAVYSPNDPALYAGLASYKGTRHLVAAPQPAVPEAAQPARSTEQGVTLKFQTCRRHPSAGRFLAECSGCKRELFDIERRNREAAAANADIIRSITVGPYKITTRLLAPTPGGFSYGTEVWGPASEDDALAFDMTEGAPLLLDQAGAHDKQQAIRDYVTLADEYTDRLELQAA